jgi:metal-dependent hydrolase (beta-lactamase superfamily II)
VLLKNLTIAEAFYTALFKRTLHHLRLTSSNGLASSNCKKSIKMARVRSTARVSREGEETEVTKTMPISKVMERSGLVVTEGVIDEGAPDAEAKQTVVEEDNVDESEEDYSILIPTKPSHLVLGTCSQML